MKNKSTLVLAMLLIGTFNLALLAQNQETTTKKPKVNIYGHVKTDYHYDTRQNVGIRLENALLYPKPALFDKEMNDINEESNLHFSPIQARLGVNVDDISVINAEGKVKIEGEFFGMSEQDINGFRLRHSFLNLVWKNGFEILAGQTWHPMFLDDCIPSTGSFNTGMPFNPFARNPQFQLKYKKNKFSALIAAVTQLDMFSNGPAGPSTTYLRNSAIPELSVKASYNESIGNHSFTFGSVGTMKTIKPRLSTSTNQKTNESISTFGGLVYGKYSINKFSFKMSAVLGQDMYHLSMIGGYAIKNESYNVNKPILEQSLEYTPLVTSSLWSDISYGKKWQIGLFGAYSKNLGSFMNVWDWTNSASYFARGRDISYLYRIAPRFVYEKDKLRIGSEIEYTAAAYGKTNNSLNQWLVVNDEVANVRALIFMQYSF